MPNADPTLYAVKRTSQNGTVWYLRVVRGGTLVWVPRYQDASLYSSMTEATLRAEELHVDKYEVVPV